MLVCAHSTLLARAQAGATTVVYCCHSSPSPMLLLYTETMSNQLKMLSPSLVAFHLGLPHGWMHTHPVPHAVEQSPRCSNSLTCMNLENWVCSRLLVSALLSLPSGSAELLYTSAAVAKAFSRSEPFSRARGEKSYQPIRKSSICDIIERNLSEAS